jgi:diguanylate cyclase
MFIRTGKRNVLKETEFLTADVSRPLAFTKRLYPPRVFGLAIAFPPVAVVYLEQQAPWHFWAFAVFCGFVWPHLAYWRSRRSDHPTATEYSNLMTDSTLAGFMLPLMSFNLLPVLVMLTMIGLVTTTVGGARLLFKGCLSLAVGALCGWLWALMVLPVYTLQLAPSLLTLVASAPLMVAFPVSIGFMTFRLSGRLAKQKNELEQISRTDGLTQLCNRRFWEECVFHEFERHKRYQLPLSLIMIDIDHFKNVNDEFGHLAGDQMLSEISQVLSNSLRQSDVAGRYGGEEFGILLPGTELKGAMLFAERLRLMVHVLTVKPYEARCTISLGVAELDGDIHNYRQLIECADNALYESKRLGRNMCMAYQNAAR